MTDDTPLSEHIWFETTCKSFNDVDEQVEVPIWWFRTVANPIDTIWGGFHTDLGDLLDEPFDLPEVTPSWSSWLLS